MRATGAFLLLLLLGSCSDPPKNRFQGYVEGEFVYVASPLAGQLEALSVQRGQQVTTGQSLFALDETPEKAAREQIEAALVLSEAELARQEKLSPPAGGSSHLRDGPRLTGKQDKRLIKKQGCVSNEKKRMARYLAWICYFLLLRWEGVQTGKPGVVFLPPQNIKVRAF